MKLTLTLLTALLLAALASLHAAEAAKPVPMETADTFPDFNWDRVPLNIHFGKGREMTDAELDFIATHSGFVAIEKSHGVEAHGSREKGMADTARRLRQRNPRIRMLFYFNAFNARAPEHLKADLDSMALAATKGKLVVLKGWPGFSWLNQEQKDRSHAENLRLARERITFPLACFLIGGK